MIKTATVLGRAALIAVATVLLPAAIRAASPMEAKAHAPAKWVAYDAKDRKYYSVEYAKSHGMHDRGGDKLIIISRSKLPKGAKLSHAMHGIEP